MQNKDTNSQQRNKRFFGLMLGTLQKFKTEDKVQSETTQVNRQWIAISYIKINFFKLIIGKAKKRNREENRS